MESPQKRRPNRFIWAESYVAILSRYQIYKKSHLRPFRLAYLPTKYHPVTSDKGMREAEEMPTECCPGSISTLFWDLRNGIFPALSISKQGCHSHQGFQQSNVSWWALRALRMEKNTCDPAAIKTAGNPCPEPQGSSGCEKTWILTPESWDAYERDTFREPSLLHLPIYRKALNFLMWDIWFSLISNNLLMFRLPPIF